MIAERGAIGIGTSALPVIEAMTERWMRRGPTPRRDLNLAYATVGATREDACLRAQSKVGAESMQLIVERLDEVDLDLPAGHGGPHEE